MSECIEKEIVISVLQDAGIKSDGNKYLPGISMAINLIHTIKTAERDAVLRCKDCERYRVVEYYHPTNPGMKAVCDWWKIQVQPDDFCAWGDRKDA